MLEIKFTSKMKHDFKLMQKRGKNMLLLEEILCLLAASQPLPAQYKDHQLLGKQKDFRECHIEPDWLLVYQILKDELVLSAIRTGTHSDLFGQ
jgi:mRNA interferase YafQ